jgi:hypothetical protein
VSELNFTKAIAYLVAIAILVGTYYALVLYPYALDADIKLWLTGLSGGASTFIFGDQVASRTARNTLNASDSGAEKALSTPTLTVDAGPPVTATMTPADPTTVNSDQTTFTTGDKG